MALVNLGVDEVEIFLGRRQRHIDVLTDDDMKKGGM